MQARKSIFIELGLAGGNEISEGGMPKVNPGVRRGVNPEKGFNQSVGTFCEMVDYKEKPKGARSD